MDIFRGSQEIELNGRRMTVYRRGLAYYYQLLYWYYTYVRAELKLSENTNKRDEEWIKIRPEMKELLTAKKQWKLWLCKFVSDQDIVADFEIVQVTNAVLSLNNPALRQATLKGTGQGDTEHEGADTLHDVEWAEEKIHEVECAFLSTATSIIAETGWTFDHICENVDHVQAFYLLHNFRRIRADRVSDNAAAFSADPNGYIAAILGTQG